MLSQKTKHISQKNKQTKFIVLCSLILSEAVKRLIRLKKTNEFDFMYFSLPTQEITYDIKVIYIFLYITSN